MRSISRPIAFDLIHRLGYDRLDQATLELLIKATIAQTGRPIRSPLASLAVAGALLVAACNSSPSPSPSPPPAPSATASSLPGPSSAAPSATTAAACTSADVGATGGPWGGAAGSRGSDIVVANHGTATCLLPASPAVALVDAGGSVLLSTPVKAGSGPAVAPGGSVGFSLVLGNWCEQGAQLPLHFRLALAADVVDITNLVAASVDDLPPCNGPGEPPSLSTTDWQP